MRNGSFTCSNPLDITGLIPYIGFVIKSGNRRISGASSESFSILRIPKSDVATLFTIESINPNVSNTFSVKSSGPYFADSSDTSLTSSNSSNSSSFTSFKPPFIFPLKNDKINGIYG